MNVMPAWNDQQIARYLFRFSLFIRRGLDQLAAEQLGDRLAFRDFDRDERRVCLECSSYQHGGRCFQACQGVIPMVNAKYQPVTNILHRCDFFSFQKP